MRRKSWSGRLAFSGILGGHCLAYLPHSPATSPHHPMIAEGGHSAGLLVASVALGSAVAGVVAFLADRRPGASGRRLYLPTAARLTALQAAGFLTLEFAERLLLARLPAATIVPSLAADPAVQLGLVLQLWVAGLAAAVLVAAVCLVERRRHGRIGWVHPSATLPRVARQLPRRPRKRVDVDGHTLRGPPPSLRVAAVDHDRRECHAQARHSVRRRAVGPAHRRPRVRARHRAAERGGGRLVRPLRRSRAQ